MGPLAIPNQACIVLVDFTQLAIGSLVGAFGMLADYGEILYTSQAARLLMEF